MNGEADYHNVTSARTAQWNAPVDDINETVGFWKENMYWVVKYIMTVQGNNVPEMYLISK